MHTGNSAFLGGVLQCWLEAIRGHEVVSVTAARDALRSKRAAAPGARAAAGQCRVFVRVLQVGSGEARAVLVGLTPPLRLICCVGWRECGECRNGSGAEVRRLALICFGFYRVLQHSRGPVQHQS